MRIGRKQIQLIILTLTVLLGCYVIGASVFGGNGAVEEGGRAPSFDLLGLDGKKHTLNEYRGKAVVLNFWGSWCTPCKKEMPALQAQWSKWKNEDVVILAVNVAEGETTVRDFAKSVGAEFPVLLDPDREAVRSYGISPLPTTIFINGKGRIDNIHIGQLDMNTLDTEIDKLVTS
ncbi:redoxin domain-containing protein [Paenibacillus sp. HN-1]|uniref:redoxin domain-containing protein n=1 Tax=Paenibacillus TaxID=44249 RepID=UPI001CAA3160|nr:MULTISPECIES: redoxin domain-containing protein [Paenibacillus]MBY9081613.1 redoxin domain-containing protein [Paenibacillus sp. CGMCC 1.18879]MBY9083482.1 redoxin domain-containing protein [Paenibacillus sinensis]